MNTNLIDQEFNEKRYSRKFIDGYIREDILFNPDMLVKLNKGEQLLRDWLGKSYYPSKDARLAILKSMDLTELIMDVFTGVAYFQREELFTSVSAQLAGRLRFDDKPEAIKTMAEILAVLCLTDAFDICKASKGASLMVVSRIPLSVKVLDHIEQSQYLPPMVCEPRKLVNNYSSGYLTHNDSLILGQGNHHDGDICLDALNIMNSVPLALCTDLLCQHEEVPTFDLDTVEKKDMWADFKKQSYRFYKLIVDQGNRFWLTHKVDKRGRAYAQGYHINSQGTGFKKAMIELADKELVTGVP